jgi:hypothetical protein
MPGAQCTRSPACESSGVECTRVFTARSPESSGIPARNGFTAYFVISPAIGFLVTVALRKMAHPARLGVSASARLDAGTEASGPHDFTVRSRLRQRLRRAWYPSAEALAKAGSAPFVSVPVIAHGKTRPAIPGAPDAAASTASRPNVRDDGQRPSFGTGRLRI